MTRDKLIQLVERIINRDGTESEIETVLNELESNVIDPNIRDYIYWNDEEH